MSPSLIHMIFVQCPTPLEEYSQHCASWKSGNIQHRIVGPTFKRDDPHHKKASESEFFDMLHKHLVKHPPEE